MASTINNYSVGLTLDAKQYIDSSKLSRAETRALISDINKARDPAEDFTRAENRLTKAFQDGAINLQTYNRLLEHHKKKLDDAQQSTNQKASGLERMAQYATIATGAIATVRAGIDMVAAAKGAFDEVTNRIDETTKSAQKLSLSFKEFTSLKFAASEAGVSLQNLERGIKEMMKRGFVVGGDVKQSFLSIANEISRIADQSERMQRATEIFGKSGADMLVMLQGGRDAIEDSVEFSEKWNSLTEEQVIGVEQYSDTWARVEVIIDGLTNTIVAELAPALTLVADYIIDSADAINDANFSAKDLTDTIVYLSGYFYDILQLTNLWQTALYDIATLNLEGLAKDTFEAFSFDSSEKFLQALYDKRLELEQKAAQRRKDLDEQRKKQQIDDADEVGDKEKENAENFERLYRQAIENAAKAFERKAAEAKKIAESIAKGPADIEAGSSEAAKFLAEQINRNIAANMEPAMKQSEQMLLDEASKQLEELVKSNEKQQEQVDALKRLVEVTSQNGFRRL